MNELSNGRIPLMGQCSITKQVRSPRVFTLVRGGFLIKDQRCAAVAESWHYSAAQRQKAVSAHPTVEQILPFGYTEQVLWHSFITPSVSSPELTFLRG